MRMKKKKENNKGMKKKKENYERMKNEN